MTSNNVQNVRFLRNGILFTSREQANSALTNFTLTSEMDGSSILARYQEGTGPIKTLVGYVYYKDASNNSVTIFDIDDAGTDAKNYVDSLVGSGITSANTATAQFEALSGTSSSSSGDTSVWGAKKYADQKISDAISSLDYSDSAVAGEYVSQVTEADGVIAVTRVALPTVGAISETGKPITAVSENLGTISATAGTIDAQYVDVSYSAITATNVKGALAEIADEIDGMDLEAVSGDGEVITMVSEADGKVSASKTAIKDVKLTGYEKTSATGAIEETDDIEDALSKLENKTAAITINDADSSINVNPTTSGTDISVNIKSGEHVLAKDGNAGIYTNISLSSITPSSTTVKEEYQLTATDGTKLGDTIKIYKDSSLYEVYLGHIDDTIAGDPPVVTSGTGDTALCFIYHKEDGTYELVPVNVESFLEESEFASGVTADSATHIVHGVVDPASESFLTVGADGFKISGVSGLVENAIDALDADVSGNTTHITVGVKEENGVITAVTVAEDDIANASDLGTLSGKTFTVATSSNASITTAVTSAADGTKSVDLITDASKIKMSGFTSTDVLSGINATSSVTEAFKEVDKVITDNEETVSAALNDLNERIDELSGDTTSGLTEEIAERRRIEGQSGSTYTVNASSSYISGATSLNDADVKLDAALKVADDRIDTVSGDVETIKDEYISGVSVNGNAVTVANKVAPISITAATSAATATSTEAIVVDTDANGNITLGIANIDCGTY